jgi:hypothetical protein
MHCDRKVTDGIFASSQNGDRVYNWRYSWFPSRQTGRL